MSMSDHKLLLTGLYPAQWDGVHLLRLAGFVAAASTAYYVITIIYRLTLHPLAKVPGPKVEAAIEFPQLYSSYVQGVAHRKALALHRQYGPVVRLGPNHVAVDGAIGWPEVYAHRTKSRLEFPKPSRYFFPGDEMSLINAPKERHRRIRRQLGHAFSDAALNEQEAILQEYVQLLIKRLTELEKQGNAFNIVDWLNFTTFDIIGELAFSDSYDSLKSEGYHPWVFSIFRGIRGGALFRFLKSYPLLRFIVWAFNLSKEVNISFENREMAAQKAVKRLNGSNKGHPDFMGYMMRKTRTGETGMDTKEIVSTVPTLVVAGSETTATALSGMFFYLGQNPEKRNILFDEIRGEFNSEDDITIRKAASLEYLHACLEETLRVYPPAAETPPRLSPGAVVGGYWLPKGTRISVFQWATFRNPQHFADPDSFAPERWLPKTHKLYDAKFENDNKAVFKPFSFGTRDCIGKNLAYAEMRVIASRIFWKFDFEINGQRDWHDKQGTYVVWSKGALNVKLTKRECDKV